MVIKDGRFGPYVTDGETNASLRRGQTVEGLTVEQASEMLAEKRARVRPRRARRLAAKKAPAAKKAARQEGHEVGRGQGHRCGEEGRSQEGRREEGRPPQVSRVSPLSRPSAGPQDPGDHELSRVDTPSNRTEFA